MKDTNIIFIYNIISIFIIIIIYFLVIHRYLLNDIGYSNNAGNERFSMKDADIHYNNKFKYMPSNTRIMYENTGTYPWNRHTINSSIPYDVNVKKEAINVYYYEYDNNTYNEKLKEVFKNTCEELIIAVEGNKWGKWQNPKMIRDDDNKIKTLLKYYQGIYDFIYNKLNTSSIMDLPGESIKHNIQIVHDIMNNYRQHSEYPEYYMFDIDMILYRAGKFQGKHIKAIAITNGVIINIILIKIIGVISEDNIVLFPYKGHDIKNTNKNSNFNQFVPMKYGMVDNNTKNSRKNTFDVSDTYLDKELEDIMYKKLLEENIPEDVDISNNNFIASAAELKASAKDRCRL